MVFEFREDREAHLRKLCAEMGRSVDDFVNEAVLTFMEDYEDGRDAQAAWKEFQESGEQAIPMEEMMRQYGLEAGDLTEGAEADRSAGQAHQAPGSQLPTEQTPHAA